ncbi:hypothetical protein PV04_00574 [Phialophora macrospora]|uniref:Yeast cell wall synthesis Kre9/Knh1 C-terminal domain-containing protein n=1 Tax=Phialophora macrospora TaxID=1851006 RepID=A0A0D2D489_9EURO|nr:hypothetical protein PV04_00574 [Phialophora macrospora]
MPHLAAAVALGIFAYKAMAQTATFDPPITFASVTAGEVEVIGWTVGDGTPVSLFLGNTTWNMGIFENKPATDATFDWLVTVPADFVAGNYALALVQSGVMEFSPLFSVIIPDGYMPPPADSSTTSSMPPATTTTSTSLTMTTTTSSFSGNMTDGPILISTSTTTTASAAPIVTITVWDPECGCHKKTEIPATAVSTASGVPGSQYTWWDHECGCRKTAMVPAPTTAQGGKPYTAPAGGNVPVAPSATPSSPTPASPSHAAFTGAANKLGKSSVAGLGLIAAAFLA